MFDINSNGWMLNGKYVEGRYMGSVPVRGYVEDSRPKYGTDIQYTLKLMEGFDIGAGIKRERGETVFLTQNEIDMVIHN